MNQQNKNLNLAIAMVTAPRRKDTARRSILSLRFADNRPKKIHIFAEPNSPIPTVDFVQIHQNEETLGCFRNFHQAHRWLLDNTTADWILVLSDDMKGKDTWIRRAGEYVSRISSSVENFGYLALYTPLGMKQFFKNDPQLEIIELNRGWGRGGWGGLYLMPRKSAEKILASRFYTEHLENYEKNQQFDECMKEACLELGLSQYYVNPSLFDHVGITSTIGHEYRKLDKGLNFGRNT